MQVWHIQKFFNSHKAVIAEETSDAHKNIQESIKAIQESTEQQVNETYTALTEQSQKLKDAINENNEQFRSLCQDMRIKFKEQMDEMPAIAQNLKKLEEIPSKFEAAVAKITQSQEKLASYFLAASQKIVNAGQKDADQESNGVMQFGQGTSNAKFPSSVKWTIIIGMTLITLATIGNTAYNIWKGETTPVPAIQTEENINDSITTSFPPQIEDTTHLQNQQNPLQQQ